MHEQLTDKIKFFLGCHPHLRDDDQKLVCSIWYKLTPEIKSMDAVQFLKLLSDGKLPKADTITRISRQIQEHNPQLRGAKWEERQQKQNSVVKDIEQKELF